VITVVELDLDRIADLSRSAVAALEAHGGRVRELAAIETTGTSPDGRVVVRATGAGGLTGLELRDGVVRRHDGATLSELVTRVVRETQGRARERYRAAVAQLEVPELAACEEETKRLWRD
jgi:DNA-binding protein YbaB